MSTSHWKLSMRECGRVDEGVTLDAVTAAAVGAVDDAARLATSLCTTKRLPTRASPITRMLLQGAEGADTGALFAKGEEEEADMAGFAAMRCDTVSEVK